jgi:cobalt-zinc-cadmium efflux system outer membrane protein
MTRPPKTSARLCGRVVLVCLATGAAAGARVWAQQPPASPLSLEAALARALAASPTIVAARLQRPVDVAGVGVARERPNPDVTFEAARDAPKEALGLTLPIELGGKRQRRVDLAQATVSTGEAELERTIAEVRTDVRRAYFELVAAEQRVVIAEAGRTLATRARDTAQARLAARDVSQFDVVQTQLQLVDADNEVTAARGEVTASRTELNALLGQPADAPVTPTDTLEGGAVPLLEDALAQASHANAGLAVLDRQIAAQIARRDLAKALQVPDLLPGGGVTWNAPPDFQYGWRLSLGVTVPLFTHHQAAVMQEDAELVRLRAAREAFAAQVNGAVAAALARAAAAREQMTHFQNDALPLLLDSERMSQASYSGGQTGLATLLQALRDIREIRRHGLQAGLDYQLALADLERAIGAPIIK